MLNTTSMENKPYPDEPLPLNRAARLLRVPAKWLRAEADAGRVPHLRAGRAILIHVPTVAKLLGERAQRNGGGA